MVSKRKIGLLLLGYLKIGIGGAIMEDGYFPEVIQVVAGEDRTVYAYFTDGTIHLYDMKPLIRKGGIFTNLNDRAFFKNKLTVMNHTIAWDISGCFDPTNCIDIDPYEVYQSEKVDDPLEETS